MNRRHRYYPLKWIVEVAFCPPHVAFEAMAAFNVKDVAIEYAKNCNPNGSVYRVLERYKKGNTTLFRELYRSDKVVVHSQDA